MKCDKCREFPTGRLELLESGECKEAMAVLLCAWCKEKLSHRAFKLQVKCPECGGVWLQEFPSELIVQGGNEGYVCKCRMCKVDITHTVYVGVETKTKEWV